MSEPGWAQRLLEAEAERDRLRESIEVDRAYNLEVMRTLTAERDRLRAVVDGLRGYLSIQDVHEEDSPEVAGVLADLRGILAGTDT